MNDHRDFCIHGDCPTCNPPIPLPKVHDFTKLKKELDAAGVGDLARKWQKDTADALVREKEIKQIMQEQKLTWTEAQMIWEDRQKQ